MTQEAAKEKVIGRKDMVLFTVSAILLLDTLAATAAIGPQSIFWWLILGLLFFLPFGLISAELGCSYPEQGGIYAWVRDAFGARWGSRVTWSYWVNVAIWMPAIYILFAGVFKQLFYEDLSLTSQITLGLILTWLAVFSNVVAMDVGKWVPNIGAIFKVVIFVIIIVGAVFHVQDNGMANSLTLETMSPDWSSSLQYIPAVIYGMLGFELISSGAEEMKDPSRDVPASILMSGLIILVLYVLGTVAVLAALPTEDVDLVEGLIDTLVLFFGGSTLGNMFVVILGCMALFTFFSNGVTWAMGGNRAAAEAAEEGELPRVFGLISEKRGTPAGAAVMMGVVSSLVLVLYGFLVGSNEDLFWTLFSFSGVIFLWPYIGMVFAFLHMRKKDPHHPRPFKIAGGLVFATVLTWLCALILVLSIILFLYVPGEGVQWPVLIGAVVALLAGEIAIQLAERDSVPTETSLQ